MYGIGGHRAACSTSSARQTTTVVSQTDSYAALPEALRQDPAVQRLQGLGESERALPHALLRLRSVTLLRHLRRMRRLRSARD